MSCKHYDDIVEKDGYLVDQHTGEKVVFYECDPEKNTECDKSICRTLNEIQSEGNEGFCSKTIHPEFAKDGGKKWYAILKTPEDGDEPFWGREYI